MLECNAANEDNTYPYVRSYVCKYMLFVTVGEFSPGSGFMDSANRLSAMLFQ